jgi:hypothetical protein
MAHGDRSVDVFVRKLRQKLQRHSANWRYIHTHFGIGYRFDPEPIGAPAPRSPLRRRPRRCCRARPADQRRRGRSRRRSRRRSVPSRLPEVHCRQHAAAWNAAGEERERRQRDRQFWIAGTTRPWSTLAGLEIRRPITPPWSTAAADADRGSCSSSPSSPRTPSAMTRDDSTRGCGGALEKSDRSVTFTRRLRSKLPGAAWAAFHPYPHGIGYRFSPESRRLHPFTTWPQSVTRSPAYWNAARVRETAEGRAPRTKQTRSCDASNGGSSWPPPAFSRRA